jgi:hypothetical protein
MVLPPKGGDLCLSRKGEERDKKRAKKSGAQAIRFHGFSS